jgi:hypothetical protein
MRNGVTEMHPCPGLGAIQGAAWAMGWGGYTASSFLCLEQEAIGAPRVGLRLVHIELRQLGTTELAVSACCNPE